MDLKYSREKIDVALLPWVSYRDSPPDNNSIPSRLGSVSTESTIMLKKKYHLYSIPILPSHFFLLVDGKEFHPGAHYTPIFIEPSNPDDSYIMSMEECCGHCTYNRLINYFETDKNYSLGFNNCQNILGENLESCLLWLSVVFTTFYIVSGIVLYVVIALVTVTFVVLRENVSASTSNIEYTCCPHIKRVI